MFTKCLLCENKYTVKWKNNLGTSLVVWWLRICLATQGWVWSLVVVQLLSLNLFIPLDCSMPGFPVLHYPLELAEGILLSQWCHPTISSSVDPFSPCPQSFPASECFPMSRLFTSVGQSIGASASASVLPMDIQGWFSLRAHALEQISLRATTKLCLAKKDPEWCDWDLTAKWINKQKRNEKAKYKTNLDLIRKGFIQKDYCKGRK